MTLLLLHQHIYPAVTESYGDMQFCMWETSIMRIHDDPESVLSNAEAGIMKIRLLEQARPGKEADA